MVFVDQRRTFGEISQLTGTIVNDHLPRALPLLGGLMLVQLALLAWRSQSIGKLLLGLRIVREADGGPAGVRDTTTTIEAKWLGACKPDQKPGDIVMPGGYKMNIKDAEKLKGLAPK